MLSLFIRTTREIIDSEGMEQVSIRKIGQRSGYNSATFYSYFQDLDELITISSMSYLEDYCGALARELRQPRSSLDTYLLTWELFGQYAFTYPQVFQRLFFHPHSKPLAESIARYYECFPQQLACIDGAVKQMLRGGSLEERDIPVLAPLAAEGLIRPQDAELISELAVSHFRSLLEEKCAAGDGADNDALLARQMLAVRFLLRLGGR
jgi:AcrR family transcriptional regulator